MQNTHGVQKRDGNARTVTGVSVSVAGGEALPPASVGEKRGASDNLSDAPLLPPPPPSQQPQAQSRLPVACKKQKTNTAQIENANASASADESINANTELKKACEAAKRELLYMLSTPAYANLCRRTVLVDDDVRCDVLLLRCLSGANQTSDAEEEEEEGGGGVDDDDDDREGGEKDGKRRDEGMDEDKGAGRRSGMAYRRFLQMWRKYNCEALQQGVITQTTSAWLLHFRFLQLLDRHAHDTQGGSVKTLNTCTTTAQTATVINIAATATATATADNENEDEDEDEDDTTSGGYSSGAAPERARHPSNSKPEETAPETNTPEVTYARERNLRVRILRLEGNCTSIRQLTKPRMQYTERRMEQEGSFAMTLSSVVQKPARRVTIRIQDMLHAHRKQAEHLGFAPSLMEWPLYFAHDVLLPAAVRTPVMGLVVAEAARAGVSRAEALRAGISGVVLAEVGKVGCVVGQPVVRNRVRFRSGGGGSSTRDRGTNGTSQATVASRTRSKS